MSDKIYFVIHCGRLLPAGETFLYRHFERNVVKPRSLIVSSWRFLHA